MRARIALIGELSSATLSPNSCNHSSAALARISWMDTLWSK